MDKTDKIDELFRYVRESGSELSLKYVKEYDTYLLKMTPEKDNFGGSGDASGLFGRRELASYQTVYPDEIHKIFPEVLSLMVADLNMQKGGL